MPGKFLGTVGQDRSDSTSNQLHVDIFRFCFHSVEVHSIDSFKMMGAMVGENQQLVTDEPVEVQDYRRVTDCFRGIY